MRERLEFTHLAQILNVADPIAKTLVGASIVTLHFGRTIKRVKLQEIKKHCLHQ